MSDFEITALVLAEHEVFRREFSALEDLSGQELAAAWEALHAKLEVHAVAEEQLFYPLLAQEADGEQETAEGVHDHNEIRRAAAAVGEHEVRRRGCRSPTGTPSASCPRRWHATSTSRSASSRSGAAWTGPGASP